MENSLAYDLYDRYPINEGLVLTIPKRHYSDFFESRKEELDAIFGLLWQARDVLDVKFKLAAYNMALIAESQLGKPLCICTFT